jgi:hypothetical protein
MYEIVNKGLNNLNGVYSGVARHNWCQKWNQWRNTSQYIYIVTCYASGLQDKSSARTPRKTVSLLLGFGVFTE